MVASYNSREERISALEAFVTIRIADGTISEGDVPRHIMEWEGTDPELAQTARTRAYHHELAGQATNSRREAGAEGTRCVIWSCAADLVGGENSAPPYGSMRWRKVKEVVEGQIAKI